MFLIVVSVPPPHLADFLIDVREGALAAESLPLDVVILQVELEHLVKVVPVVSEYDMNSQSSKSV